MSHEQPQPVARWGDSYPRPSSPPATSPPTPAPQPATGGNANAFQFVNSRATRHLCVGTYLDEDFRLRVLDEVYHEPRRAVAPAAGSDGASVALHAKRSHALALSEAGVLLGIMVLFLCATSFEALVAVVILILWAFVAAVVNLVLDIIAMVRGKATATPAQLGGRVMLMTFALVAFVLVLSFTGAAELPFAIIAGLFDSGLDYSQPTPTPSGDPYGDPYADEEPADSDSSSAPVPLLVLVVLGLPTMTVAGLAAIRRLFIRQLRLGVGPTGLTDTAKSQRIRYGQYGDVVNYSGYTPFIGHGVELWTWQLPLPLYPRADDPDRRIETDGPGFTVPELIYAIHCGLHRYVRDTPGFKRLPELVITDQAFVAGVDTREPVQFTSQLPRSGMPGDMMVIKTDPTLPVRHYLKCQINSWEGELVTTIFVAAAIQGETLYMEFSSYMLPPTKEEYHVLQDKSQISGAAVVLEALKAVGRLPARIGRSPFVLLRALRDSLRAAFREVTLPEEVSEHPDHGAKVSIRELGTDLDVHNYFQERDAVKYTSILEAQILEHSLNFLERFIDISELRLRKDTIVNNTVINQGTVYTASQTGPGTVGSQGPRSQNTPSPKAS